MFVIIFWTKIFKKVCNCPNYFFFINSFTSAAFMDLHKTPKYIDLLIIFVIGLIRIS